MFFITTVLIFNTQMKFFFNEFSLNLSKNFRKKPLNFNYNPETGTKFIIKRQIECFKFSSKYFPLKIYLRNQRKFQELIYQLCISKTQLYMYMSLRISFQPAKSIVSFKGVCLALRKLKHVYLCVYVAENISTRMHLGKVRLESVPQQRTFEN